MSNQLSFTKYEHQVLPAFRKRMSQAESTEDVRKFFNYTVGDLFQLVFDGRIEFGSEDLTLRLEEEPHYLFGDRLQRVEELSAALKGSDLSAVLQRIAATAVHHYRHLEKHPEKTRAKIRG